MLERSHVQSSGFANLPTGDHPIGFRVRMRQPNYRGTRVSLMEGIDVTVNGETFPAPVNRYLIGGQEYSYADLDTLTDVRWSVGSVIDVLVAKDGGLTPGVYMVETIVWYRHPYFPPQFRPIPVRDGRYATIVF